MYDDFCPFLNNVNLFHLKLTTFCDPILYFTYKLDACQQFSKCTTYNSSKFEVQLPFSSAYYN